LPPDINKIILDGLVPSIEEVIVNLSDEPLLRITTSVTRAVEEIEKKKKFAGWRKNFVYVIVFHVVIILLVIFLSIYFPKMTF
jgi:t-SNARE complex subunit (syntaxin)